MPPRAWIALLSLWPGLAQIWTGQELLGLLLAACFSLSLNASILSHFVWTAWPGPAWSGFLTLLSATTWIFTMIYTVWWLWRLHPDRHRQEIDRLFREALELYLQGRWSEARQRCELILARDETDADCLMQLGMIYVRSGHPDLAQSVFRQCLDLEGGRRWRWEISQALQQLAQPSVSPTASQP
ncbi:MAG: hypothetical protein KatS3mg108_0933 [Isosphaeraceae bacterium]|jgi:tetratricopeptide (TPR) repeat protein|nr:MAG: hypothetical protein KatS3mg108_0933 [Isosphaeraceae bacterium]